MKNHRSTLSRVFFAFVCIALLAVALPGGGSPAKAQQIPPVAEPSAPAERYAPDQLLLRFRPGLSGQRADEILAQRGLSRMHRVEALDVDVLRLPPGLSVERAVAIYSRHPEVEFAEPNYVLQALEISDQWGLQKVRAEEAWPVLGTEPPEVLLATVDTGIDRNHTDLADNIWTNPDEITDNSIDDDNNGYVDDTWGWDFVNNDNDPMDDMMHGTAVSSVSAGVLNGSGVAGVCPWCQLMAVKVLDAMGSGYLDTVAQGITYAADNGARVINLSLGATAGAATLEQAVTYAWGKGAVVVAAAGNNGLEEPFYPAAYERAMAVGSTNEEDYRSCFSNYSADFITVTAPGEAIVAATPNQGYGTYSGTSLAAPHVTGLAGLLFSQDPNRTNDQVWALIEQSAVDLGPVGKDGYFGWGRVDAYRAVSGDTSPTTPPQALFTDDPSATGYAHARKVARDGTGKLHWVWHTQEDGQYQVLYATSSDGGQTWTPPEVVFSSTAETYHPALAVDDTKVYIAFPSKQGSATYRVFFSSKALDGGAWPPLPDAVLGGAYDAVRPDLHVDAATGNLHLVASSLDNAPDVYHTWSNDHGGTWQTPTSIPVGFNSRYADVYAHAGEITLAVRTVEFWFIFIPRYHLRTFHSSDGGDTWQGSNDLATHDGILTGEYGLSLTGLGNQLTLAYEHAGNIHFGHSSDGLIWTLLPDPLGAGAWPTLTQAGDGQAWALWDRSSTIIMRHYTGSAWETEEVLGTGTYPNLKADISGNLLEWVVTRCSAPYCMTFDSKTLGDNDPPVANNVNETIDEDPAAPVPWTPMVDDPDGDTLTCSLGSPPSNGSATVESDCSSGTYTPAPDSFGTDTFTYSACDPGGLCDSGMVTYQVNPVQDPPVAENDSYSTDEDAPLFVAAPGVLDNDYDLDGDALAANPRAGPSHGALTLNANGSFTYDPDSDYHGLDTFTYDACDPALSCDAATVTIDVSAVNDAPMADDVSDATAEDTGDTWYPHVSDLDDETLSCTADTSSIHGGTVTVASNCSLGTYNPPQDHNGEDSFYYTTCDSGGLCDSGMVIYQVNPVNDRPVASFTISCEELTCDFDASGSSDVDSTSLIYAWQFGDGDSGTGAQAQHTYDKGGTYTVMLTATDDGGETGTNEQTVAVSGPVTVHVSDLDGSSVEAARSRWEATVTITIQDSNETAVPGAVVDGNWSNGATGGASCTTDDSGQCFVSKGDLKANVASVTFGVSNVSSSAGVYEAADNQDPDEDSEGTTIIVNKPVNNTSPTVTITNPDDGTAFASGTTISFAGTASDAEDGDLSADLAWTSDVDGAIGSGGSFGAVLSDGVHTISATVTDLAGASGNNSVRITVGTLSPPVPIHVGDLDGTGLVQPGGKWNATVDILVHDADEKAVPGATVSGVWGGGSSGSGSCTTDMEGWCSITLENISKKASSVTFTVLDISLVGTEYNPSANHDPDGDSSPGGSAITIQPK